MTTRKEENKRMLKETFRKREVLKNAPITVEQYKDWKAKGHSDVYIMEQVEMHNAAFNEWKHAAGLIGAGKTETKKEVVTVEPEKELTAEVKQPEPQTNPVEQTKELKKETAEVEQLKYQVRQMDQMKLDHAETLKDYTEMQAAHAKVLEEMERMDIEHNKLLVKCEELEEDFTRSSDHNKEICDDLTAVKKRVREVDSENDELNKEIDSLRHMKDGVSHNQQHTSLKDAEMLNLLLAKRFVSSFEM